MPELNCFVWLAIFGIVFLVCMVVFNIARVKRDGIGNSSETIHGLPPEMGFKYKNDCNDPDSWTGE